MRKTAGEFAERMRLMACGSRACPTFYSDALERFKSSGADRRHELLIVPLVLIGVALGEVGDRLVELVAVTQVPRGPGGRARPTST